MSDKPTADKLAKVFIKIRDAREALKHKYEEEDLKLETQMDEIESMMLSICKENNVDSMKTEFGTIIRSVKTRYWTSDWEKMYAVIKEHECLELLEKRIAQNNMKQFLEEHKDVTIEGLNLETKYSATVRRAKGK